MIQMNQFPSSGAPGFLGPEGNVTLFNPNTGDATPTGINDNGQIVGFCGGCTGPGDSNLHGFIRDVDGTITIFDPPNALNTRDPLSINNRGQITGQYQTTSNQGLAFIRSADGVFTILDPPAPCRSVTPFAINNAGEILGICAEGAYPSLRLHGFVRDAQGNFTIFDPPGSAQILTPDMGINASGQVAGCFQDISNNYHCFVRDYEGDFSVFDLPGTQPGARGINDSGAVTGVFYSGGWRGFFAG